MPRTKRQRLEITVVAIQRQHGARAGLLQRFTCPTATAPHQHQFCRAGCHYRLCRYSLGACHALYGAAGLGLRALNVITDALAEIERGGAEAPDFDQLDLADAEVYGMIAHGDTIGASQVESRAQMGFGPRLQPTKFTELMMQVAMVRPGPIQVGSANPLLRRRAGQEPVTYAHACLEPVLRHTYGVLLYQEQAIQIAMAAAGFTPGEADLLRRALARADETAILGPLRQRFVEGAARQGIDESDAQAIYQQLAGFAGYGFCKSHAGSLALAAYAHLWLKCYHPGPFYVAILNNQPMGFYSPEVIINDAQRHGVVILPPDIQASDYVYTLKHNAEGAPQMRTGLRAVKGMGGQTWRQIEAARQTAPFASLHDLAVRTRLPQDLWEALIMAGALDTFGARWSLLWQLKQLDVRANTLALPSTAPAISLPALHLLEQVAWEYELVGYSAATQIMALYRPQLGRPESVEAVNRHLHEKNGVNEEELLLFWEYVKAKDEKPAIPNLTSYSFCSQSKHVSTALEFCLRSSGSL